MTKTKCINTSKSLIPNTKIKYKQILLSQGFDRDHRILDQQQKATVLVLSRSSPGSSFSHLGGQEKMFKTFGFPFFGCFFRRILVDFLQNSSSFFVDFLWNSIADFQQTFVLFFQNSRRFFVNFLQNSSRFLEFQQIFRFQQIFCRFFCRILVG